jgi:hypothetical protein
LSKGKRLKIRILSKDKFSIGRKSINSAIPTAREGDYSNERPSVLVRDK